MAKSPIEDYEFKIILPKKDNSGNLIDPKKHLEYAIEMSKRFNGVTVLPHVWGCFADENHAKGLVCEENIMLISNRDNKFNEKVSFEEDKMFIRRLSKQAGFEFGQYSIFMQGDKDTNIVLQSGLWKKELPKYMRDDKIKFQDLL